MATLNLDDNSAFYQIRSYTPGHLQINELKMTQSVIVSPSKLIDNWTPQTIEQLSKESLSPIFELKPDILLIGTGSRLIFPSIEIYGELINQGIGVEVMNTSAACRTYNALTSEHRNVAAALIIL